MMKEGAELCRMNLHEAKTVAGVDREAEGAEVCNIK